MDRVELQKQIIELRSDLRFQNLSGGQRHILYKKSSQLDLELSKNNVSLLRYSIENKELTEFRVDLDEPTILENIILAKKFTAVLENLNFQYSVFASGGKGLHIQFLLCLSSPLVSKNFIFKTEDYNKKELDVEFKFFHKNKLTKIDKFKYPLLFKVHQSNLKRKLFKQIFLDYFKFPKEYDTNLLSSLVQLQVQGFKHRKTPYYKIYIPSFTDLNNKQIMAYIEDNKEKSGIINKNFLNELNTINDLDFNNMFKIIKDKLKKKTIIAKKQKEIIEKSNTNKEISTLSYNQTKNISDYLRVFYFFYKKNRESIHSNRSMSLTVIKFLCSRLKNNRDVYNVYDKFIEWTKKQGDEFLSCVTDVQIYNARKNLNSGNLTFFLFCDKEKSHNFMFSKEDFFNNWRVIKDINLPLIF
jgi:hypothetical protein